MTDGTERLPRGRRWVRPAAWAAAAVLAGAGFGRWAAPPAADPAASPSPPAVLRVADLDLGDLPAGGRVEAALAVTNAGPRPLSLAPPESSCGCVASAADPLAVPAGETVRVPLTVDVPEAPGRYAVSVSVRVSNGGPYAAGLVRFRTAPPELLD